MKRFVYLKEEDMPKYWYNVKADLPFNLDPPLDPHTMKPVDPQKLEVLFPKTLVMQEATKERYIEIPQRVREAYALYRPTPLVRAVGFEKALKTPAHIYYKNESVSPTGSHKLNTALAQAYYNLVEGTTKISTETGAGQWGSALAFAGAYFNLDVNVFMVKISFEQKPARKYMVNLFNGKIHPSPSDFTNYGKKILEIKPDSTGSLGMAISEAIEFALSKEKTHYSLGSVLDHVLLHQTVIGQETQKQLELVGEEPDVLIGCFGGGSNFGGFTLPFIPLKMKKKSLEIVACEPTECPSFTKGEYKYDYGDTAHLTPMLKMYTLGSEFVPPPIYAGGLRYHGASPIISRLVKENYMKAIAIPQDEAFEYAKLFAITEGIIPAPETSHAIAGVARYAKEFAKSGEERVIVFNFSGHGLLDLNSYVK
ncbi:MAG: TrpB-like pyridoxal phosphate-dependent enzyme [Mesoaciditoga sp.]|uniref:TrpB-like pyridoxal phosphate-dependent enzyme n=1 Tax=Athalassotoga sp. TaxID=2022597 RepID=UPI000CC4FAB1|nr:MAG: TrpB-like pyridoxal phosphate-dependent enzyme [Mesoaciditoga sp.]PMP80313.1 MAG: TrpB-like pyridoxal phosphate-dependent enzyme [Mesoaciditoga sp.]HEU23851.1 TrpB-like pyridoxal phosphate-dependent enzyme [Mesoaciditoga lauensis]